MIQPNESFGQSHHKGTVGVRLNLWLNVDSLSGTSVVNGVIRTLRCLVMMVVLAHSIGSTLERIVEGLRNLGWCIGYELTIEQYAELDRFRDLAFTLVPNGVAGASNGVDATVMS